MGYIFLKLNEKNMASLKVIVKTLKTSSEFLRKKIKKFKIYICEEFALLNVN